LHTGYLRLQEHNQIIKILLVFHCKNDYMKVPQCYVRYIACVVSYK
jgi:hypothetical protein